MSSSSMNSRTLSRYSSLKYLRTLYAGFWLKDWLWNRVEDFFDEAVGDVNVGFTLLGHGVLFEEV